MNLLSQMSMTPIDCFFQHVASGNQDEVERLLSQGDSDKDTVQKMCHPLCFCDKCEKLVSGKLNDPSIVTPFSRDDRGFTPLHIAAICGQASLIDLLVSKGAVVNATDYHGSTPLHLACQKGYQNVTLLLLHYKASTEIQDNNGNTPLHLACTYGHEDCVKALVYYDVNSCKLDIGNEKGDTPLHIAARWGYQAIIEVLLENGANPDIQNRMKETSVQCALNSTILSLMELNYLRFERRQSASQSLTRSEDTASQASSGSSLSSAATTSINRQDRTKAYYKEVEKLLRAVADGDLEMHGASVPLSNNEGNTALHKAVMGGHEALVRLLLQYRAPTRIRNNRKWTPLDYAEPNSGIFKLLQAISMSEEGSQIDGEVHTAVKIRKKSERCYFDADKQTEPVLPFGHKSPKMAEDLVARRLQLVQSISQFNKSKYLRKTITRDKSVPNFDDELMHQLAIKSFDKSKLKPVDLLKQSRAQILDAGSRNELARDEDDPDVAATPPLRSKLMQRRHTVNVALLGTDIHSISDVPTSRETSVSSLEGHSSDEELALKR
uniref:Uncharacterized protein n=1 Tax=Sphaerodactylus townsendi TaxID=933632 RepID=A0ACB8EAU8_9SAUR